MIKERGEPYFPVTKDEYFWPGATLRDAFAMAAMQGMFACEANPRVGAEVESWNGCESHCNGVAKMAYRLADAMLAAREVKNGQA